MDLKFEVKRNRGSVTQGIAIILVNGIEVITFGDKIELNGKINNFGDWGSNTTDEEFIKATIENYGKEILKALK